MTPHDKESWEILGIFLGLLFGVLGIPLLHYKIQDYRQKRRNERMKGLVSRG